MPTEKIRLADTLGLDMCRKYEKENIHELFKLSANIFDNHISLSKVTFDCSCFRCNK